MHLLKLVELVSRVRATTKKTEKMTLLAEFLSQTHGRETELGALYLCGALPQGKICIGGRLIEEAMTQRPPSGDALTLTDVDHAFDAVVGHQGSGSTERKVGGLRGLFARARADEREFLGQLMMGEIRQGALEWLLLDAVAKAAVLPSAQVRQVMKLSGNIGVVTRVAMAGATAGLSRFS